MSPWHIQHSSSDGRVVFESLPFTCFSVVWGLTPAAWPMSSTGDFPISHAKRSGSHSRSVRRRCQRSTGPKLFVVRTISPCGVWHVVHCFFAKGLWTDSFVNSGIISTWQRRHSMLRRIACC
jgi:hypothetical protein